MRPLDDEVVGEEETSRLSLLCLLFGVGTDILAASYFKKDVKSLSTLEACLMAGHFVLFSFQRYLINYKKKKNGYYKLYK